MSAAKINEAQADEAIDRLKVISGRRIEDERRRRRLTQRQFARRTGLSTRWLREIEAGNPAVRLDDHLRCANALAIAPTYIFLPLLYQTYGRACPVNLAIADLSDIEQRFIALISRRTALVRR
jgi:transcriptional regulator with XRE-family HTH domain